jgi:hypothetical protein
MIVCTGFVNSGTRLLHAIVKNDMGLDAMHLSYPHWDELWDWCSYPDTNRWVIIQRRRDIAIRSAHAAGHPGVRKDVRRPVGIDVLAEWYDQAIRMFATIPGAYWLSYEALVAAPDVQVGNLAKWLQVGSWKKRQIRDENAKWLDGS